MVFWRSLKEGLKGKGQNCQQWEKEIDQIVYQLYDLTPAEIALIENP